MAASHGGEPQPPLSVRTPTSAAVISPDLPPISALFLIEFDVKAGYTITWKRTTVPGPELEGTVEYKSLPSGLHTVSEDLIYFIHTGGYAGLSAFVNAPTEEEEARNARMIAVGVLVPLSYGRLGRSWRHAEELKEMARRLVTDRKETDVLEQYWAKNKAPDAITDIEPLADSPLSSPTITFQPGAATVTPIKGHLRKRSASDAHVLIPPSHRLSPFHPAWSLTGLLDTFGPLIFPIHRAALLRKRILISTHAPVHEACNYVYDISVLSNMPLSVLELLDPAAPAQRLRPLFNIGVHDIPFLLEDKAAAAAKKRRCELRSTGDRHQTTVATRAETGAGKGDEEKDDDAGSGWVACTTDSILAMKDDLWDVLVTLPPPHSMAAKEHVWPTVELGKGTPPVRATQRDLRRFRNLTTGLARLANSSSDSPESLRRLRRPGTGSSALSVLRGRDDGADTGSSLLADAAEKIVEPTTWAALAYSGFMWWASAGEQRRSEEAEESAQDASLLADLIVPGPGSLRHNQSRRGSNADGGVTGGGLKRLVATDSVMSIPGRRGSDVGGEQGEGAYSDEERRQPQGDGQDNETRDEEDRASVELAITAYFRRLTRQILDVLAEIVEIGHDDDDSMMDDDELLTLESPREGDLDEAEDSLLRSSQRASGDGGNTGGLTGSVRVDSEALSRMGLDVWSAADVEFVKEVTARYFALKAKVESKGVEVCGLRVC